MATKTILACGYYGFGNTGDEAILQSLVAGVRALRPKLRMVVVSGDPAETTAIHGVDAVSWRHPAAIAQAVRDSELVIIGGGGLFHDYWGVNPDSLLTSRHWGVSFFAAPAVLAALYQKPLMLYALGIGPLFSRHSQQLVAAACEAASAITVRDRESKRLLESIGVNGARVLVTADAAFTLTPETGDRLREIGSAERIDGSRPLVAVAVRPWDRGVDPEFWQREVALGLDLFLESQGGRVLFIPFQRLSGERENDRAATEKILCQMQCRDRASILSCDYSPAELAGLLGECDLIVGMRLHSLLFGMMNAVPLVALNYDPKVSQLMESAGCANFALALGDIDGAVLADRMKQALADRQSYSRTLKRAATAFRSAARENDRIAVKLLEKAARRTAVAGPMTSVIARATEAQLHASQELEDRLQSSQRRIAELDAQVGSLGEQLVQAETHVRSVIDERERTVTELNSQLAEKDELVRALSRQLAQAQSHAASVIAEREKTVSGLNAQLATKDETVRSLAAQLAAAQTHATSLLEEREKTVSGLNTRLVTKDETVRALAGQLAAAQTHATSLLEEREKTLSGLNVQLATKDETVRALAEQLAQAQSYTMSLMEEREKTVSRLNATLAQANESVARLKDQLVGLVAATEKQSAARREEILQLRSTLERMAAERDKVLQALSTQVAQSQQEVQALQQDLDHWRDVAYSTRSEVEQWRRSYETAQTGIEFLRAELARWHGSRLWLLGVVYWNLLSFLRSWESRLRRLVSRPAAPQHSAAEASPGPPAISTPPGVGSLPTVQYDLIVLPIIDWDFRFQRPQQIATQFARHGHRVFYLSTTVFLPPNGPPWEIVAKAKNVVEIRIRSRRALDIYGGKLDEEDLQALEEAFQALSADFSFGDAACMVQIPFWGPLASRLRERLGWRTIYDCMDEWTNFPGFGQDVLDLEEGLVRRADVTVASADRLVEKLGPLARRLVLARNGVDLEHYRTLYGKNELLEPIRHPVIGYYGALASWVDVPLLEKIAKSHPKATIVLAGGHFDVDLSPVASLPNVRLLGQRPYEEMPRLLWNFDVCMIPFLVNDITEATNPVKFYEYVFSGKPVVAPELTELQPYTNLCYLAKDHDEFLAQLRRALKESKRDPRRLERRKIAEANDWKARYEAIHGAIRETYPLVSVVIVTFGGLELTQDCLESLLARETWPRFEVIVVDNASSDGTPDYLRSVAHRDSRVRVIFNSENLGFAAANNQGIAASKGEVLVLLNNDTVIPPGLLGRLVAHLERDGSIGLLCPTTNFCGNEAKVTADYTDVASLPAFASRRAAEFAGHVFDIAVATMYCLAARREVLDQIGPLDEEFGVGMFEDDDFSLRARKTGYRVVCAEDAYVHHVGQGSFGKLSPAEYDRLWKKNQAYFEKKWGIQWKAHVTRDGVVAPVSKIGERGRESYGT